MNPNSRRLIRHFVTQPLAGATVTLDGRSANYLGNTLRLGTGAQVVLFNGTGTERFATVTAITRGKIGLQLGEARPHQPVSPLNIRLVQGLAKGEAMDAAIQKATELGVAHISPVTTQFSVVKLPTQRAQRRLAHWQNIAWSACEQCGRHYPPQIEAVKTLAECLADLEPGDTRLVLDPTAEQTLAELVLDPMTRVTLLIGPEGGLSCADTHTAQANGFNACSMGPRILRTETAAMAACAILQNRVGDLR
jgi:16S rRNA (uracil1498-N3)-methyltransferase